MAGLKTISLALLIVLVALAGVSPVLASDGAFLVLTPTEGCPGTLVSVELTGLTAQPTPPFLISSSPDGLLGISEFSECGIGASSISCGRVVLEVPCSGRYTVTFTVGGQSASAYFDVPSTCPGVRSCAAVGGCVQPVNTFTLLSPWLAVIGLVGCVGTIAVFAKPWKKPEN